jgi:hypothetical protein
MGSALFGSGIEVRASGRKATLETDVGVAAHSHAPGIGVDCSRDGEPRNSHGYDKQLFPHGFPPGLSSPSTSSDLALGNGPQCITDSTKRPSFSSTSSVKRNQLFAALVHPAFIQQIDDDAAAEHERSPFSICRRQRCEDRMVPDPIGNRQRCADELSTLL